MTQISNNILEGKQILVTGGCGLVGSRICHFLNSKGAKVKILDNLSAYPFDYRSVFGTDRLLNCEFILGDIREQDIVENAIQKCDIVIHAAALADVAFGIHSPQEEFHTNVVGTQNVLNAALRAHVQRLVFISSASVYGNHNSQSGQRIFSEDMPLMPISNYGVSKLWGEQQARVYSELYGLSTVSLRYFSVYGATQIPKPRSHSWCIAIFASQALRKKPLTIFGDGSQIRDFIHVDDVAMATIQASVQDNLGGHILNIGTGKPTSILQIAEYIVSKFPSTEIKHLCTRKGDPLGGFADMRFTQSLLLNWQPTISLQDGIDKYIEWLSDNLEYIPMLS